MVSLENQLTKVHQEESRILKKIDERDRKRSILCGGCDKPHEIGNLTAIQTHWHVPPHGDSGGDYWKEGELQFVCPETGIVNRLLFYNNDLAEKFKSNYKRLFKEVKDKHDNCHDREIPGESVNNTYVRENCKKFGLIE
jgi:hypothetical protein